jgi:hypothetical protein
MILLVHMLFGALIGEKISNVVLAIILAYFGHYFLDLIPHIEYEIENITEKKWKKALPQILLVGLDFFAGISLIVLFSKNYLIIYVCAFFAILPDGFSVLSLFLKHKILEKHSAFHQHKIHFLKNNPPLQNASAKQIKISNFWRIFTQVAVVVVCIILLKS